MHGLLTQPVGCNLSLERERLDLFNFPFENPWRLFQRFITSICLRYRKFYLIMTGHATGSILGSTGARSVSTGPKSQQTGGQSDRICHVFISRYFIIGLKDWLKQNVLYRSCPNSIVGYNTKTHRIYIACSIMCNFDDGLEFVLRNFKIWMSHLCIYMS